MEKNLNDNLFVFYIIIIASYSSNTIIEKNSLPLQSPDH